MIKFGKMAVYGFLDDIIFFWTDDMTLATKIKVK